VFSTTNWVETDRKYIFYFTHLEIVDSWSLASIIIITTQKSKQEVTKNA
jgi:hypothetical protein